MGKHRLVPAFDEKLALAAFWKRSFRSEFKEPGFCRRLVVLSVFTGQLAGYLLSYCGNGAQQGVYITFERSRTILSCTATAPLENNLKLKSQPKNRFIGIVQAYFVYLARFKSNSSAFSDIETCWWFKQNDWNLNLCKID